MRDKCDLAVLGGGTGGYAAAFRASELGLKTVIIERDKLGGTCLHRGCIPTKSLLHSAALLESFKRADRFGLHFAGAEVNWGEVSTAKNDVVEKIYAGLQSLARAHDVEIINGQGRLGEGKTLEIDRNGGAGNHRLDYENLVLATGSEPKVPPGITLQGDVIVTSDQALFLAKPPASVIVLGGGYVGIEFASLWRSFGAEVTIVEMAPRLMMQEDAEISAALAKALEERGIRLYLDARLEAAGGDGAVSATITTEAGSKRIEADQLMVAIGRRAVVEGLESAGVAVTNGAVDVDARLRTSRSHVYAVGDLLATPQLAHTAFAEGILAAEDAACLDPAPVDYDAVPHCVYGYPETAAVGLTEEEARRRGFDVKTTRVLFEANARAKIAGEAGGEVKVVTDGGRRILGVHMIGANVTEMVSEAMLLIGWEADAADAASFVHPHPTLSEAIGEAVLKLAGKPLHVL